VKVIRGEVDFRWKGSLKGTSDGRITYSFNGEAHSSFERMRIGFCLLHAENECAGKSVDRTRPDGTTGTLQFPATVHPEEPVRDIRALEYEAAPGVRIRFSFEGDTFEMEDQRNWTDASFKTYSTPASLPRPVRLDPGDRVTQAVHFEFAAEPRKIFPILIGREPQFNISTTPVFNVPSAGFNIPADQPPADEKTIELLRALSPGHLRADLLPESPEWQAHLDKAAAAAAALGTRLHLAISDPAPSESLMEELAAQCRNRNIQPSAIQFIGMRGKVLTEKAVESARQSASRLFPGAALGVGSDKDYAQVNTNRFLAGSRLHPVYGICPQVHAFDNLSLVENLTGQIRTVESVQTWWPQTPMIASVHLHRYPGARALYDPQTAAGEWDPRHSSLFAASWAIGSLSRLLTSGHVHSLTLFDTHGPRGLMSQGPASSIPEGFRALPGCVYPLYLVFRKIAGMTRALRTHSSHPWETDALTLLDHRGKRTFVVANHTGRTLQVRIKSGTCEATGVTLGADNVLEAMRNPEEFLRSSTGTFSARGGKLHLDLPPHGSMFLDEIQSG
jgi:hypothetical protein